ncbi:MAG: hypothetical protein H6855_00920 [Rhodospirillales bacterium]|nr:hypothetical protein [Rhodospirillales bacterium]MCB9979921.1 hypothetical protein [Rhodospirillales bacterium]
MSDTKKFIQEHAVEVIEKFGGIRPMASKLGVAVTTIQGWKKRGSIPSGRFDDIINAANENKISLVAPATLSSAIPASVRSVPVEEKEEDVRPDIAGTIAEIKARIEGPQAESDIPDEDLLAQQPLEDSEEGDAHFESRRKQTPIPEFMSTSAEESEDSLLKETPTLVHPPAEDVRRARSGKSGGGIGQWLFPSLIGAGLAASVLMFWPVRENVQSQQERLDQLEENLQTLKQEQHSFLKTIGQYVPEDVQAQFSQFQKETGDLGKQVGELAGQAQDATLAAIGADNIAALKSRMDAIQTQMSTLVNPEQVEDMLGRFALLSENKEGQEQLDRAVGQLRGIISSLDGRMDLLGEALVVARENSTALGETFNGVPDEDLKAGALLLGLTQFRSSLNRGDTPFKEDLALLYSMVGNDSPELRSALDRLAPQAERGVLTPEGLANEFRGLAGDMVVNALQKDDATMSDQAKARLSKVLQIKKGGEPILQDRSSQALTSIQTDLEAGNLIQALQSLQTLDKTTMPDMTSFMRDLNAAIAAQEVSTSIGTLLNAAMGGPVPLNLEEAVSIRRSSQQMPVKLKNDFKNLNIEPQE